MFKGKQRNYTFNSLIGYTIIVWSIIIGLMVFFLSSGRPALGSVEPLHAVERVAMGNAVSLDIHLASVFEVGDDPIPYKDWNTSSYLDGWYKMIVYQWALSVFHKHEEMERKISAPAEVTAPHDASFWYGVSGFFLVIAAGCILWTKELWPFKRKVV